MVEMEVVIAEHGMWNNKLHHYISRCLSRLLSKHVSASHKKVGLPFTIQGDQAINTTQITHRKVKRKHKHQTTWNQSTTHLHLN